MWRALTVRRRQLWSSVRKGARHLPPAGMSTQRDGATKSGLSAISGLGVLVFRPLKMEINVGMLFNTGRH